MATPAQILELRNEVQELTNEEPYTDAFLGSLIDAYGMTGDGSAPHKVWIAKRNAVANLVDISEGGSSRKMSQLFDRYAAIVKGYESGSDGSGATTDYAPRSRRAERF